VRLDLLMEELRVTLIQARRTLKSAGDGIHGAEERLNGKEIR
jgi:hypothetical protein